MDATTFTSRTGTTHQTPFFLRPNFASKVQGFHFMLNRMPSGLRKVLSRGLNGKICWSVIGLRPRKYRRFWLARVVNK